MASDNLSSLRSYIKNTPHIKYSETISVLFLLELTYKENVEWLRGFISQHIPSFFQLKRTLFHIDYQRDNILKQVKRKVKKLQEDLYFEDTHNKGIIREGLPIVTDGWQESNEIIRTIELEIYVTKKCILYSDESEYCNKRSRDDFSKCLAGAGLVGGINREELQSILALLGITRQNKHQQYFDKQEEFFSSLYQIANISAEDALSHVREASQASGEIIFNRELEDEKCITIQEDNYDSSSQQMKHAILIVIIEKISTILEKYNIKLNIGINGDLSTNKTLAL
ncbi:14256_t:CDS:2 [Funneliformis mosseae]|uniref:14256_t:CDS:1 n=1 Tax=Funneliformis mosseae TaxID=27381 RepID=A0A9N9HAC6_FUNMO|nr:14256_t:CDS:2 [Funneliformis mosseae]